MAQDRCMIEGDLYESSAVFTPENIQGLFRCFFPSVDASNMSLDEVRVDVHTTVLFSTVLFSTFCFLLLFSGCANFRIGYVAKYEQSESAFEQRYEE